MKRNVFGDSDSEDDGISIPQPKKLKMPTQDGQPKRESSVPIGKEDEYMDFHIESDEEPKTTTVDDSNSGNSLDKPIFHNNSIGLSLMQKMGFKIGQSLGVSGQGIKEPIRIVKKSDKRGLKEESSETAPVDVSESIETYVSRSADKHEIMRNSKTISKLQRFCYQASDDDMRVDEGVVQPKQVNVLWRLCALEQLKKPVRKRTVLINDEKLDNENPESDDDAELEEWELLSVHEQLAALLKLTRGTFFYCPYCQVQFRDKEDLEENCPGPSFADHDP